MAGRRKRQTKEERRAEARIPTPAPTSALETKEIRSSLLDLSKTPFKMPDTQRAPGDKTIMELIAMNKLNGSDVDGVGCTFEHQELTPAWVTHLFPHSFWKTKRLEAYAYFTNNLTYDGKDIDRLNAYKASSANVIWLPQGIGTMMEPHLGKLLLIPVLEPIEKLLVDGLHRWGIRSFEHFKALDLFDDWKNKLEGLIEGSNLPYFEYKIWFINPGSNCTKGTIDGSMRAYFFKYKGKSKVHMMDEDTRLKIPMRYNVPLDHRHLLLRPIMAALMAQATIHHRLIAKLPDEVLPKLDEESNRDMQLVEWILQLNETYKADEYATSDDYKRPAFLPPIEMPTYVNESVRVYRTEDYVCYVPDEELETHEETSHLDARRRDDSDHEGSPSQKKKKGNTSEIVKEFKEKQGGIGAIRNDNMDGREEPNETQSGQQRRISPNTDDNHQYREGSKSYDSGSGKLPSLTGSASTCQSEPIITPDTSCNIATPNNNAIDQSLHSIKQVIETSVVQQRSMPAKRTISKGAAPSEEEKEYAYKCVQEFTTMMYQHQEGNSPCSIEDWMGYNLDLELFDTLCKAEIPFVRQARQYIVEAFNQVLKEKVPSQALRWLRTHDRLPVDDRIDQCEQEWKHAASKIWRQSHLHEGSVKYKQFWLGLI